MHMGIMKARHEERIAKVKDLGSRRKRRRTRIERIPWHNPKDPIPANTNSHRFCECVRSRKARIRHKDELGLG